MSEHPTKPDAENSEGRWIPLESNPDVNNIGRKQKKNKVVNKFNVDRKRGTNMPSKVIGINGLDIKERKNHYILGHFREGLSNMLACRALICAFKLSPREKLL